jgi:signal transduction histidine kinase
VLFNLCKNAIEAMPDGGKLHVLARTEESYVYVDVIDDGPGLPPDMDVFLPFVTTKPTGMGLGLPLAREIVAAHGGALNCASAPGRGTTFGIALPKC